MDNASISTGTAAPAAPPPTSSEELTAGEQAYFNSRGEDASGLDDTGTYGRAASTSTDSPPGSDVEAAPGEFDPDEVTVDASGKARTKDGKFVKAVPHSVFHAKNEKLKAIAAELAESRAATTAEREKLIRADERLTLLNGALTAGTPAAPVIDPKAPIDPEKDLFGALKQALNRINELETSTKAIDEKHTTVRTETERLNAFKSSAESFMQTTPDFTSAFDHLAKGRHIELQLAGISDEAQRNAIIGRDARALVAQAEKEGKNPAQRLYDVARARGYQPKVKTEAADPDQSEAAKALARTNANQAASVSLGASGGAAEAKIGLKEISEMSDSAFMNYMDKFVAKNGKPAWDKYMRTGAV